MYDSSINIKYAVLLPNGLIQLNWISKKWHYKMYFLFTVLKFKFK